jgi:hypothetical protein
VEAGAGRAGPVRVVVVAADAARFEQYDSAFRAAAAPVLITLDAGKAEALLTGNRPEILVLDDGLPRLVLFLLYGLVREDERAPRVQVVFVGQDGQAGPGDHYLSGERSPSLVAEHVISLVASARPGSVEDAASELADSTSAPTTRPEAADLADRDQVLVAENAASSSISSPPAQVETRLEEDVARPVDDGRATSANGQADGADGSGPDRPEGSAISAPVKADKAAEEPVGAPANVAAAEIAAPRPGRRLDVILVRIGLVLLIIGGLLILLQVQSSQAPLVAPTLMPITPTRRPAASPSPSPSARYDVPSMRTLTDFDAG